MAGNQIEQFLNVLVYYLGSRKETLPPSLSSRDVNQLSDFKGCAKRGVASPLEINSSLACWQSYWRITAETASSVQRVGLGRLWEGFCASF